MGCGVFKPAVKATGGEDAEFLSEPLNSPVPLLPPTAEDAMPVKTEQNEPQSSKSFSPKSLESDSKSTSSSDEESLPGQSSPIRIKAQGEEQIRTDSSPALIDNKKGFVAFDVPLDGSRDATLDVLRKPLPKRLRHLEPLGHTPQITTEMLMEKLEKAEEKRQRALARYKEHANRRKELALRRTEQMGDTISATQQSEDIKDSDQSTAEKSEIKQLLEPSEVPTNTCNENVNWNESDHRESPMRAISQGSRDSTNQNNNNLVELRTPALSQPDRYKGSPDPIQHLPFRLIPYKSSHSRHNCFLQAVQEEQETETETSSEDILSLCTLTQPRRLKGSPQQNNSCIVINEASNRYKNRQRGL